MRGLLAAAILVVAPAGDAVACQPFGLTPRDFASAHVVVKASVTQVDDSGVTYALITFDTEKTYSGEARPEWQVVWQNPSIGEVPFGLGQTYIVGIAGLAGQNLPPWWSCWANMMPCPRNSDGESYPQIMTNHCVAPASLVFPFSPELEAEVIQVLEAAR